MKINMVMPQMGTKVFARRGQEKISERNYKNNIKLTYRMRTRILMKVTYMIKMQLLIDFPTTIMSYKLN